MDLLQSKVQNSKPALIEWEGIKSCEYDGNGKTELRAFDYILMKMFNMSKNSNFKK